MSETAQPPRAAKLQRLLITAAAMQGQQESGAFVTQEAGAEDLWGSKATRAASWSGPGGACRGSFFPPEHDTGWIKEHGRLVRWRIQTVVVSPEEIGLCGCWLLILVERWQQLVRRGRVIREWEELSYSCTNAAPDACRAAEWLGFIRGHWAAMENGSHYRRDVSLGEDACRIRGHNRAQVMATLRNVVLGLFELQKHGAGACAAFSELAAVSDGGADDRADPPAAVGRCWFGGGRLWWEGPMVGRCGRACCGRGAPFSGAPGVQRRFLIGAHSAPEPLRPTQMK